MTTLGEGRGGGAASGVVRGCVCGVSELCQRGRVGVAWSGERGVEGSGFKLYMYLGRGARGSRIIYVYMWWQRGRACKLSSAGSG